MIIDTEPREVTLKELKNRRANAKKGITNFNNEIAEINKIEESDINEALEVERKLGLLKKFRKSEKKQEGLRFEMKRYADLDKVIKDMESKNQKSILIK